MSQIANVNFEILLKMHNGDKGRALAAWNKICSLGKFGDVPPSYQGGLDVKGLNIAAEESEQGSYVRGNPKFGQPGQAPELYVAPIGRDEIKRIEDLASGDKVKEN